MKEVIILIINQFTIWNTIQKEHPTLAPKNALKKFKEKLNKMRNLKRMTRMANVSVKLRWAVVEVTSAVFWFPRFVFSSHR